MTPPLTVELTLAQLREAATIGVQRRLQALERGRQHRYAYDGANAWQVDIAAAASEYAVALVTARPLPRSDEPDYAGDVGPGLQVRWTPRADGGLVLHPGDPDDHAFVLVRGRPERLEIVGWCRGREGKLAQHWRENVRHPCFIVPAGDLRAMPDRRVQLQSRHAASVAT